MIWSYRADAADQSEMENQHMPWNLPAPTKGGDAPSVEDGLAVARFDDILARHVPDFVTEKDNYGKPDDGNRIDFQFTLMVQEDKGYAVAYTEGGDPIELRQGKACKPGATGEKSNFRMYLAGILTPQELAAWEASTEDAPFDGSAIKGRLVHVKIAHNKRDWPEVEQVISPVKGK